MGRAIIKLSSKGIRALLNSAEVRAELTKRAEAVKDTAISTAPVVTGNYQSSIHIEQVTTDRAVVRVVADAPHSHLVNANTGHLVRALDAAA